VVEVRVLGVYLCMGEKANHSLYVANTTPKTKDKGKGTMKGKPLNPLHKIKRCNKR